MIWKKGNNEIALKLNLPVLHSPPLRKFLRALLRRGNTLLRNLANQSMTQAKPFVSFQEG